MSENIAKFAPNVPNAPRKGKRPTDFASQPIPMRPKNLIRELHDVDGNTSQQAHSDDKQDAE
jgi:hypothetical protein